MTTEHTDSMAHGGGLGRVAGQKYERAAAAATVHGQIKLIRALHELDSAWQRAVLSARAAGEDVLLEKLSKQWDDYEALVSAGLTAQPTKLFK